LSKENPVQNRVFEQRVAHVLISVLAIAGSDSEMQTSEKTLKERAPAVIHSSGEGAAEELELLDDEVDVALDDDEEEELEVGAGQAPG
jgi:hypothetical protein